MLLDCTIAVISIPANAPMIGVLDRLSTSTNIGFCARGFSVKLTKLADETGGECFSLGTSQLVSFQPSLERLQKLVSNQYYLVFQAVPRKKAGLQRINIQTELSNSEILAPDNVWVAAAPK